MNEYLKAQNRTNEFIMEDRLNSDELNRFSKSDFRWADNRITDKSSSMKIKKGEIYQFEFGKSYVPEIAYEHRGLVIGIRKKLLYVLPIFSYDSKKHPDVYHPIDNPNSKSDLFLLKNSEFSFIKRDSVLKLNDIRTVSTNRILYKHQGSLDIHSDTYKQIEDLAFHKLFPGIYYEFAESKRQIENLNDKVAELGKIRDQLENEIESLKSQCE